MTDWYDGLNVALQLLVGLGVTVGFIAAAVVGFVAIGLLAGGICESLNRLFGWRL